MRFIGIFYVIKWDYGEDKFMRSYLVFGCLKGIMFISFIEVGRFILKVNKRIIVWLVFGLYDK